eukprot:6648531-Karenia_brevis.AAC.1
MRYKGRKLLLDVISFIAAMAAISACKKGGQWQRMALLLHEMQRSALAARRDQFLRSHFSLREGWAVAIVIIILM